MKNKCIYIIQIVLIILSSSCTQSFKVTKDYIDSNKSLNSFDFSLLAVDSLDDNGVPTDFKIVNKVILAPRKVGSSLPSRIYFNVVSNDYHWICNSGLCDTVPFEISANNWYLLDHLRSDLNEARITYFLYVDKGAHLSLKKKVENTNW